MLYFSLSAIDWDLSLWSVSTISLHSARFVTVGGSSMSRRFNRYLVSLFSSHSLITFIFIHLLSRYFP